MITVVITCNGRPHLFRRTIESFLKYLDHPVEYYLIYDDSCNPKQQDEIWNICRRNIPENKTTFLTNIVKNGQVNAIDFSYSHVKTKYIFHLEEDWEFYRTGFMKASLSILEIDDKILTIWLREHNDTNLMEIDKEIYSLYDYEKKEYGQSYQYISVNQHGGAWHGFTWNPGLRRLADYKLVAPFSSFIQPNDFAALTECRIGQRYYDLGFRAAILPEGYCKHIG